LLALSIRKINGAICTPSLTSVLGATHPIVETLEKRKLLPAFFLDAGV